MLDSDLAELYDVPTGRLNEQVKRNIERFPDDFMLQLTQDEYDALRSQVAILKPGGRGQHRKYLPRVFTEQDVAMLSTVLNSNRAIQVNIAIVRAFVRLREVLATHKDLARRMAQLEREQEKQGKVIAEVFEYIQKLLAPPKESKRRPIGFRTPAK